MQPYRLSIQNSAVRAHTLTEIMMYSRSGLDEAQKSRQSLLERDEELRTMKEANSLQLLEIRKWEDESHRWQRDIKDFDATVLQAQQTEAALDQQLQVNMVLKETIDRLRFELDELRTRRAASAGTASIHGSVSKSLGAELLSKMKDGAWEDGQEHEEEEHEVDEPVEEAHADGSDTEGEDVIRTIITRTKRVSPSCYPPPHVLTHCRISHRRVVASMVRRSSPTRTRRSTRIWGYSPTYLRAPAKRRLILSRGS